MFSKKRDGWCEGLATFENHRGFLKRAGVGKKSPFGERRIWPGLAKAEIAIILPAAEDRHSDSPFPIENGA